MNNELPGHWSDAAMDRHHHHWVQTGTDEEGYNPGYYNCSCGAVTADPTQCNCGITANHPEKTAGSCVIGCQLADHERLGHDEFLRETHDLYLLRRERELLLDGWERGWVAGWAAGAKTLLDATKQPPSPLFDPSNDP